MTIGKPYHRNPRSISRKRHARLKDTLARLGDLGGIVHNLETDEIIGGNQRVSVFEDGTVELIEQFDEPDEQGTVGIGFVIWNGKPYSYRQVKWDEATAAEANIVANIGAGTWDSDIVANQWDAIELQSFGFDEDLLKDWQQDSFWLGEMLESENGKDPPPETPPQIDKAEELREKWGVELGQLWQLGEHRLICGDCTDRVVVERVMGGERADLQLTDPPYGIDLPGNAKLVGIATEKSRKATGEKWDKSIPEKSAFDNIFETSRNQIIFGANYFWEYFYSSQCYIIWDKRGDMPDVPFADTEFAWTSFVNKPSKRYVVVNHGFVRDEKGERLHPTQKPLKLWSDILGDFSCEDELISDFFTGSGTTIIAAENLGRRAVGIELDPGYCAVTLQRWHDHTGKQPQLLE